MSISPPSDIILDVARAADPLRYQEAAGKLNRAAPGGPGEAFQDVLGAVGRPPPIHLPFDSMAASTRLRTNAALTQSAVDVPPALACATPHAPPGNAAAFKGFESMALTSMIESMLPTKAEAVFGAGSAGQIWKSMLSEQMAAQIAEAGGVGIADMLSARAAQGNGDQTAPDSADDLLPGLSPAESVAGPQGAPLLRNPASVFADELRSLEWDDVPAGADET